MVALLQMHFVLHEKPFEREQCLHEKELSLKEEKTPKTCYYIIFLSQKRKATTNGNNWQL